MNEKPREFMQEALEEHRKAMQHLDDCLVAVKAVIDSLSKAGRSINESAKLVLGDEDRPN